MESDREALDEHAGRPFLEAIEFLLAVTAALDVDSPACRRYRFSHCLPIIAMNPASGDIRRLVHRNRGIFT